MAYKGLIFTPGVIMAGEVILGPELVNGGNLLLTTQTFQRLIMDADPAVRPEIAEMFGDILGLQPTHYGSDSVEIQVAYAYMFGDELTQDSVLFPDVQMTDARLRGRLGPVVYFEIDDSLPLLAWTLKHAYLRDVSRYSGNSPDSAIVDEVYKPGTDIRRPVYVPVTGIQTVLVAA